VEEASPGSPEARRLIGALSRELADRYGEEYDDFSADDIQPGIGAFLLARIGGDAVGCGAIRRLGDGVAEVKRMYVEAGARNQGVGGIVLAALEAAAVRLGYGTIALETGVRQPEAIALYERAGYRRIPCVGKYADAPLSICYEKELQAAGGSTP
jgi:GNAT superfamily N-acetyltransferase